MKTKIAATLVALACVASIGFPAAAADDASTARTLSAATATPVQPRPETSGQFVILSDVRADALSSKELDSTRGAARGLVRDPKLLLLDEPTVVVALDFAQRNRW